MKLTPVKDYVPFHYETLSYDFNIDELIMKREIARHGKDFKTSDELRNKLDSVLVFVFDLKESIEVYHLTPSYFKFKNKFEETVKMSLRKYVEFKIQQDIAAEKLFNAWLFSTRASMK